MSVIGPGNLWSRRRGVLFWAGKSGRSLQRATRGGACERACARARVRVACRGRVCCCSVRL